MRRRRLFKFLKGLGLALLTLVLLLGFIYLLLPKGPRATMPFDDPHGVDRPAATSDHFMAATGNPWATQAALQVMQDGGNAVDAAVASLLVLNVTFGEAASVPGVAPVLVYDAQHNAVESYIGAGTAPAKATIESFKGRGRANVPEMNIWSQLLPASPDVIIALLEKYGTKSFAELSAPAIRIAKEGYPVHDTLLKDLDLSLVERLGYTILMPYNAQVYLGGQWWRPLHHAEITRRLDLANTFESMAQAEQSVLSSGGTRQSGLQAVRDDFYKGEIAQKIVAFHAQKGGLFTAEDLANYQGAWEKPLSGQFGDYTIFANNTWTQGGVVLMALQMLDGIDLKAMGHNSPEYAHTVLQAIELAMADREAYFDDPQFVQVPIQGLLDPRYAQERRKLMTPGQAFTQMPPPGDPARLAGSLPTPTNPTVTSDRAGWLATPSVGKDTSYLSIVDAAGNAVSMTPQRFPQNADGAGHRPDPGQPHGAVLPGPAASGYAPARQAPPHHPQPEHGLQGWQVPDESRDPRRRYPDANYPAGFFEHDRLWNGPPGGD